MDNTGILVFDSEFHSLIKELNTFIKSFFLESHKTLQITTISNNDKVLCSINMGRFVIKFLVTPVTCKNLEDIVLNLPLDTLKKYAEMCENKQLKLLVKDINSVSVYVNDFLFPINTTEAPEAIELPYIQANKYSEEICTKFQDIFKNCYQKENLITIKSGFLYEKLTDYLYHIEPFEFEDISLSYEDLKLIHTLVGKDSKLSYTIAPRFLVFKTTDKTFYIMKYKLDTTEGTVFKRRTKISKADLINRVFLNTQELKNIYTALNVTGVTEFGLAIGNECKFGGKGLKGYVLSAKILLNQVNQGFVLSKKEINLILKTFGKSETITVITGKDFMLLGNKLLLMMRSIYNGT